MTRVASAQTKKLGTATLKFANPPAVVAAAAIGGPMEGRGPLGGYFDRITEDRLLGQKSWEQAEIKLLESAVELATQKAGLKPADVDFVLAGDLLNQTISANFAARTIDRPFFGVFAACATWTEGLTLGSLLLDGGFADTVVVGVSSHHDTAERQYRFPTEFGNQRPPTAQWTVTGAAAVVLRREGRGPYITHATIGRVVDMGIKNPFDMGSAMAPAAADTLQRHFEDTARMPEYYDLILTGDLARVGLPITQDLLKQKGYDISDRSQDCGILMFDPGQDVHAGASGAACSGSGFAGFVVTEMARHNLARVLFTATGALLSPTSYQQGESIPCIAHAVVVETEKGGEEE